MLTLRPLCLALLATSLLLPVAARAQDAGPGWFKPAEPSAPAAAPRPRTHAAPRPARDAAPMPMPGMMPPAGAGMAAEEPQPVPLPLPPVPDLPALPKTAPPPTAVIGVLGVPDVMRESVAAQAVEKTIGERRDKLNADAQKEQAAWREMQQSLANDRTKLSTDQLERREHELQDRITTAQKKFRDRNQVIQQAAQYALSQIERTLIGVIRQVSESRGMNLVLHRAQVALNVNEFDITAQVKDQLNKVLPSVSVPPDGMTVQDFLAQQKGAAPSDAAGQAAKPK